ncbi:hypothetical protein M441DRAFT_241065 [Trichoderma asperellum CBS 433.97]|uniref:Uncharacterized protein n=1 Tax=Trichoderma asperellum (strain ATCC 204424 / CBS 433.97 / NBRC 101777) TaxID=1042311 RepID=A0A2T3Z276_TRIA4|nr:hypothetical protein M441DRAFT_241065 [Trichoderma asperellum CBS 433.97]PTB38912.1 hypothetical protein M441DRAFT_241065 [Trichoderma asperellum CBS 433.97]
MFGIPQRQDDTAFACRCIVGTMSQCTSKFAPTHPSRDASGMLPIPPFNISAFFIGPFFLIGPNCPDAKGKL